MAAGTSGNMVHRNLILIRAARRNEAYEKALRFGREADMKYDNPNGERVTVRFHGISHLEVIHDDLEDGAELSYRSDENLSEEQIAKLLRPKEALNLFLPQ
jgi:hypothetical protein